MNSDLIGVGRRTGRRIALQLLPATTTPLPKLVLISLAATSIEWYDFFLYGTAAALVFPTVFFAGTLSPSVALIASFGTFAVGFVARPVGAVVFGHFGDWKGRKSALVTALYLMGQCHAGRPRAVRAAPRRRPRGISQAEGRGSERLPDLVFKKPFELSPRRNS